VASRKLEPRGRLVERGGRTCARGQGLLPKSGGPCLNKGCKNSKHWGRTGHGRSKISGERRGSKSMASSMPEEDSLQCQDIVTERIRCPGS